MAGFIAPGTFARICSTADLDLPIDVTAPLQNRSPSARALASNLSAGRNLHKQGGQGGGAGSGSAEGEEEQEGRSGSPAETDGNSTDSMPSTEGGSPTPADLGVNMKTLGRIGSYLTGRTQSSGAGSDSDGALEF